MSHVPPTGDTVKLTAHFAERERAGSKFLAEALLDLFAERGISNSIMLRGIASFGPRNIVRSDESLSLSEDLPVLISAIDRPPAITAVADEVAAVMHRGLLTVERARSVQRELPALDQDVKLSLYVGRQQQIGRTPAYQAACTLFHSLGFTSATAFLGVDGTVGGQRRRARFLSRNADVPMLVSAVGTAEQAVSAGLQLAEALGDPLLTVERVQVCKRDGQLFERPALLPGGLQKLTVLSTEDKQHQGVPIHRALVSQLRTGTQASGATSLRGFWGFHGEHRPHGDSMLRLGRQAPVSTIVVESSEVIAQAFDIVDALTAEHGLVICEKVPAALAIDGGRHRGGTRLTDG